MATYDAFISYSHAADGQLAPATRRGLEQLARPWRRRRALRVFQDHTGLAASPDLWESIASALNDARFFVLLASPEAAQSHWVQQELRLFLSSHPVEDVLLAVTAGELQWDRDVGDFTDSSTAVPPQLRGLYEAEPLWVDLRWASTELQLDVRNNRFRASMADLAAPIHGLDRDELDAEDLSEFRRGRRIRRSAMAVIAALTVVASVSSVLAAQNARDARHNAAVAEENATLSDARRLAAQARALFGDNTDLGLLLAAESMALRPTSDGLAALAEGVSRPVLARTPLANDTGPVLDLAVSPDGQTVATASATGIIRFWRAADGTQAAAFNGLGVRLLYGGDSQHLVTVGDQGVLSWSLTGPKVEASFADHEELPGVAVGPLFSDKPGASVLETIAGRLNVSLAVSGDGTRIAHVVLTPNPQTVVVQTGADGSTLPVTKWLRVIRVHRGNVAVSWPDPGTTVSMAFDSTGSRLALGGDNGTVTLHDTTTGAVTATLLGFKGSVEQMVFSGRDRLLIAAGEDRTVRIWDTTTSAEVTSWNTGHQGSIKTLAISADGTLATGSSDGTIELFDSTTGTPKGQPLAGHTGMVTRVAFGDGGSVLWSAGVDGLIRRWDIDNQRGRRDLTSGPAGFFDVPPRAGNPTSDYKATANEFGVITIVDTLHSDRLVANWPSNQTGVLRLEFNANQTVLATGGEDGTIRLWDTGWLAGRTNVSTGEPLGTPLRGHTGPVPVLIFSSDGATLASSGLDGTVRFWSMTDYTSLGPPLSDSSRKVPARAAAQIRFVDDDATLVTLDADGGWHAWPAPNSWIAVACRLAGRTLTKEERAAYLNQRAPSGCP